MIIKLDDPFQSLYWSMVRWIGHRVYIAIEYYLIDTNYRYKLSFYNIYLFIFQNTGGQAQIYNTGKLPPLPDANRRDVDNRPSWMTNNDAGKRTLTWMTNNDAGKRKQGNEAEKKEEEERRKKGRLWVCFAHIMVSTQHPVTPPMPLDVDNGLPGIELWFGTESSSEVSFICHMDTCAAMNTGNLLVHQWLMSKFPHIVAEYIQYDDVKPFEPLQLHCAVNDLVKTESMHGKLTAIVRYWLRHKRDGKPVILSFGLGASVEVNSIVGITTIRQWNSVFDFSSNELVAKSINSRFPLIYESTKHGLPTGVHFSSEDFIRPLQGATCLATALLTNVNIGIETGSGSSGVHSPTSAGVTQTCVEGCHRRQADISHIE